LIITFEQVIIFLLILSRFTGMMALAPFFSEKGLPVIIKVALLFWVSGLLIFIVPLPEVVPNELMLILIAVAMEFAVGAAIGFTADLLIAGVEFAGGLMDTQAGLSVAASLDPSSGINAAIFQKFLRRTVILLFLILDGHHMVLAVVVNSFHILPVAHPVNISKGALFLVSLGTDIFRAAVILSAPIILVIFVVDFSFGVLNRVAEQINVFQLGFQVKPLIGLIIFLAISPGLVSAIMGLIESVMENLVHLMGVLKS
jgi:flagellar biosynthetic protein FliR